MPIVPMFQGGVATERDNAQTGMGSSEIRIPRPTYDYEKNYQEAIKPIVEFGKTASKAAEIIANRNVKAEADEAELKYLDIERRILYGQGGDEQSPAGGSGDDGIYKDVPNNAVPMPDNSAQVGAQETNDDGIYRQIPNGFFATQGKNSVDTFNGSIEVLKKESQKLLDGLSPWARESLQSRINDRLASAQTRMLQYRNNQEQAWHLSSSESRIKGLIRSAGDNPNSRDYLAKTKASIDAEVDYIASLRGYDVQQAADLKAQYHDLAEASRYTTWAQDNPVGALSDFQTNQKSISPEIRAKLSNELFRTAAPQLGLALSDKYGDSILDKKDFIREMTKPGARTGIPVVDGLSTVQRISLWQSAHAYASQKRTSAQNELGVATKDALSEIATYGYLKNGGPSKEQFIAAYGEAKGTDLFESYERSAETTKAVHDYAGMTDEEIASDVASAKPVPGASDFAERKKLYDARVTAYSQLSKKRREDPVAFAVMGGQYGYEPLDFGNTGKLVSQLQNRVEKANEVSKAWGANQRLFSKTELDGLVKVLDSSTIDQRVGLLTTIAEAIGSDGLRIVSDQMTKSSEVYAIAMAGMDMTPGEISPGEMYLRGLDAIDTGRVKIDTAKVEGTDASIANTIGDEPEDGIKGVFDSPDAAEMTRKMAKGVWAYQSLAGVSHDPAAAVKTALGGEVFSYNHRKIVLPRGVEGSTIFGDDLSTLLNKKAYQIRSNGTAYMWGGMTMTRDQMANALHDFDLKTEKVNPDGSVLYSVQSSGVPVYTDKGKLFTFTLSAPSKEEK